MVVKIFIEIENGSGTKLACEFLVPPPQGWLGVLDVDLSTFRIQPATAFWQVIL
ncbi:hypothetical protein HMPREF0536_11771 [Limosilactobacillus reuteri MM4-1A]|uniref:Uncharacterized protein n=1 Tax=Limosilactobacillus reuteri MM4-1A TaxID=548485 RepID=A0A828RGG4_LIMRT|nr:hypothetical protein HMPREF0535_1065 [Limosilactobacillus reuteri MM2-3]EGC14634.1 hypothetical protein HMPREF0536_11771 [Limosilactobacillus reuteri MM4-1A]